MVAVKDIMTKDPVYVDPHDLATKARSIIRRYGYRALPVVEKGRLVGIVSRGDIMRITSNKAGIPVGGLMSRNPAMVPENEDIFTAARLLVKSGIRQVLVVEKGELRGIVSSIDVLRKFLAKDYHPVKKKISEIMSRGGKNVKPEDRLSVVWELMQSDGVNGLSVVKDGKVMGVVTRMDLMEKKGARISKESGKAKAERVEKIMRTPATTVNPETDTKKAGRIMARKGIIMLPVVDDENRFLGTVDIEDIINAYLL